MNALQPICPSIPSPCRRPPPSHRRTCSAPPLSHHHIVESILKVIPDGGSTILLARDCIHPPHSAPPRPNIMRRTYPARYIGMQPAVGAGFVKQLPWVVQDSSTNYAVAILAQAMLAQAIFLPFWFLVSSAGKWVQTTLVCGSKPRCSGPRRFSLCRPPGTKHRIFVKLLLKW